MLRAANVFGLVFRRGVCIAFGEPQLGLESQDALQRLLQTLGGNNAAFHTGAHVSEILCGIVCEQDHIAAGRNGGGDGLLPRHGRVEADHLGGVGDDEPVEAQLLPQYVVQKLRRQGGGHDLLIPDAGTVFPRQRALADVAHHDRLDPVVNEAAVHLAEALLPILHAQIVAADHQMLVPLFGAVAGEMLGRAGHGKAGIMNAAEIGAAHGQHGVRILSEGTGVDDGVAPVLIDIADGVKEPVGADAARLPGADKADVIGRARVAARRSLNRRGNIGPVGYALRAAGVAVGRNQQRDPAVLLIKAILFVGFLGCLPLPA